MRFLIVFLVCVIASTVFAQQKSERDSAKVIIDSVFPNGITGRTRSVCTTDFYGNFQDLCYGYGNIAFLHCSNNSVIEARTDTLTIYWRDPKYTGGRYFLIFRNIFDEIIDYRISNTNSYKINFNHLETETFYMLTIYSEDKRASYPVQIKRSK